MQLDLLAKHKDLKFVPPPTLFPPDYRLATHGVCPYCLCKLYEMRGKNLFYCRSKKHKKKFVISKEKIIGGSVKP